MHINAHLAVDLVASEATDTVTVLLHLVAPSARVDPNTVRPEHPAHRRARPLRPLRNRTSD